MAFAPSSPVTGGAQTGFTSPTYTISADTAPDVNGKQYAVTALGGTQAGVTVHSVSSPFTFTFWRPKAFKSLGPVDPSTGELRSVPMNVWKMIVRKGVTPLSGQSVRNAMISITCEIPAGADTADAANVRALYSFAIGVLNNQSAGIGDTIVSGVV
jgi:hypothetical protein